VQNICEVKSKGTEVGTLNVLKLGHSEFLSYWTCYCGVAFCDGLCGLINCFVCVISHS
jgi:hypothetical protein